MPIQFNCSSCSMQVNAPDGLGGRAVKCPHCGNSILVPKPQPAGGSSDDLRLMPSEAAPRPAPQMAPQSQSAGKAPVASAPTPAPAAVFSQPVLTQAPTLDLPPQQMAPPAYTRAKFYSEGERPAWIGLAIKTVLLLLLIVGGWQGYRWLFAPKHPLLLAADAPSNTLAVGAIKNAPQMIRETFKSVEQIVAEIPQAKEGWNKGKTEGKTQFGFDFTEPEAYAAAGFDLSKPVTFAVLPLQQQKFSGFLLSLGAVDEILPLNTIRGIVSRGGHTTVDDPGQPLVVKWDDGAAAVQDGRIWLLFSEDEKRCQLLRTHLEGRKSDTLSGNAALQNCMKVLPAGDFVSFVDLKGLFAALPKGAPSKLSEDLLALGLSAQQDQGSLYLLLSENAEIKKHLVPGGSCREFIAKADKPLYGVTYSLAEPMKLIKYFVEAGGGMAALTMFNDALKTAFYTDYDELEAILKNGAGGVLVYSPTAPGQFPNFLFFLKLNDRAKAVRVLEKMVAAQPGTQSAKTNQKTIYSLPGASPRHVAILDDYFIFSNSELLPKQLALAGSDSWQPKCGGTEAFFVETFLSDAVKAGLANQASLGGDPQHVKMAEKFLGQNSHLTLEVSLKEGGLMLASKGTGAGVSLAVAPGILAGVALPSFARSRMAANETCAQACCKAFAEAQEIYRRTDHDNDKLLEYAQSLKGSYSLWEKQAGKGDLALISKQFAEAEGEPPAAKPFNGYCFKVLKAQGSDAAGGKRSYLVGANLTLGYALVAYPIKYNREGVTTFVINNNGTIYQKDLGKDTLALVRKMTEFNPDKTWVVSE